MSSLESVYRYHDGTKHHFQHFARSLGYLDWATQPKPFRTFAGSPSIPLAFSSRVGAIAYDRLFLPEPVPPAPVDAATLGDVLRHALGLSAWKQFGDARWALRVNPSSGNLHPTEAYVVTGPLGGLTDAAAVFHYAADRHALETRATFDADAWRAALGDPARACLVGLTSIHWREAWKYGERAFRYCQHDLGHAIAAVRLAAALAGWRAAVLPSWPQRAIASLLGLDRDADYVDAEREEPGCLLLLTAGERPSGDPAVDALVAAARRGAWTGHASQLSEDHVEWSFIDEVARATEDPGREARVVQDFSPAVSLSPAVDRGLDARTLILQRRSAVAFDGLTAIDRAGFARMLSRAMPGAHAPWDALWWSPRIHLAIFVHRVEGLAPGLYLLPRDPSGGERLRAACGREFLWEAADEALPLVRLASGDARAVAQRLSCDQAIASDGFFSLGMIAEFDRSLREFGPSFYRHLFWESGVVGQALYLEAEAAGARATGIGCFYDDPVHDVLGLDGHAFQSLYHFTVGRPVEDARLTTEPGYAFPIPNS